MTDYFRYSLSIWHWHNRQPITVKLEFTDYVTMVQNNPLHPSQKTKQNKKTNKLKVELTVYESPELELLILGFGDAVKVIQPASLAKKIVT